MDGDRAKSSVLGVAGGVVLLAGASLGQPTNDECTAPIPLVDGINPSLTNLGGTSNPSDPLFTCAPAANDVWFVYTPSCSGTAVFSMCPPVAASGIDAVMEAYSGTCGALASLGCDDDGCGTVGSGSLLVLNGVTAGVPIRLRVGSFSPPGFMGLFNLNVSCLSSLVDDFGDASGGATIARHTNALSGERLGLAVTAEAVTVLPSWYGDAEDDGIVSVANLFPGSTTAEIVVNANNPSASATSFCRAWVDRNNVVGWSNLADGLPTQSASVGPAGVDFTFGPFTLSATTPPSPFVRVRLSSNTTGVAVAVGTGAFGEVEDYVLPGTGGPVSSPSAGGGGSDAADAPVPYPPCNSTFIVSERLGALVSGDPMAPVGFPGSTGTAAWDDDMFDDGIVRIDGLVPGGSCTLTVRAINPVGAFTDNFGAWMDLDGDGNWDEAGEVFAPVAATVGTTPVTVTLGPLSVPASVGSTVATRLKIAYLPTTPQGVATAGTSVVFGEIEDYLLPTQACSGCNTAAGAAPALFALDPPRLAGAFEIRTVGAIPSTLVLTLLSQFSGPGADLSLLGAPIPPGTCFLCVPPQLLFPGGVTDASGGLTQSFAVPSDPAFAGLPANFQNFQIALGPAGEATLALTNALTTFVLP